MANSMHSFCALALSAEQYNKDRAKYNQTAKEYVKKYARPE